MYILKNTKIHSAYFSILALCLISVFQLDAQRLWVNEIHYDNIAGDVGEFIELVIEDDIDISEVKVSRYDGTTKLEESPSLVVSSDFIIGASQNGFTVYSALQNLENDVEGIALIYQDVVIEFISYEGSFIANDGPAAGYASVNVGIEESNTTTAIGFSIQRTGTGTQASDFTWSGPDSESPGTINMGQDLSDPSLSATLTDIAQPPATEPVAPGDTVKYSITLENTGDGDAHDLSLDRMAPLDPNTTLVPGSFKSTPLAYDAFVLNVQEDAGKTITLQAFDPDGDLLTYTISSGPSNGVLGMVMPALPTAGMATVAYTPNQDYFGPDEFSFSVTDDDNNVCPGLVRIQVQPVNDPPTINCGLDQTVVNSAGAQTISGWATSISVGPPNESYQNPATISLMNTNGSSALFSSEPMVDVGTGDLTFTPDPNSVGGEAIYSVTISDGVEGTAVTCNLNITVNDAPDAMADAVMTLANTNLSGDLFTDNGSGADNLGFPTASIASFGGGDLGGDVTSNMAGTSVMNSAIGGGNLTVNADGSIALTGQPFDVGAYTFMYRLTNAVGSSDATVTITINPLDLAPTVVSHTPANNAIDVALNSDITVTFSEPVTISDPASFTIAGSISGAHAYSLSGGPTTYTLNPVVDFVNFEDVTLTVVADQVTDQDAIDPPDNMTMDFVCTFKTIGLAPTCMEDRPSMTSVPGDDFHTALNTSLIAADGSSEDLLTNDNVGAPAALISEFGPDNTVGTAAGAMGMSAEGGSLTVNANGSFNYTPPSLTFTGPDVFFYELENQYGTVVCQATVAVGSRPACGSADSYTATGNIQISIAAGSGVLANDMGDAITVAVNSTTGNGALVLAIDGSFTYDPNPGFNGDDPFTYDITNGFGTVTCDATVSVSQKIWFVDVNGSGSNNGTFSNPFQTIAAFNGASGPATGDFIALNTGSYAEADGINLKNNQTLIGKGVQLNTYFTADGNSISAYGTYASSPGTRPTINTTGGVGNNGIDLGSGNTIRGLNIGNRSGAFAIKDNGSSAGTLTISNMIILGLGGGVEINNGGNLAIDLDQLSSTATGASAGLSGIDLVNVSGSFVVDVGDLTHSNAPAIIISGNTSLSLDVVLTSVNTNGGVNGIDIDNATGRFWITGMGSTSGSGGTIQNHTDDGVNITNASNITFLNLNVINNGNAVNDHGIEMTNITGTVDFNNVLVQFSAEKNVEIENTSGTMIFTADNCSFLDTQTSGTGADGLEFGIRQTATATIDIDNSSFLRNKTNGLQVIAEGGGDITKCDITNSVFDCEAGSGIGIDLAANNAGSTLNFNVIGNSRIRSRNGPAINVDGSNGAFIQGRINGNGNTISPDNRVHVQDGGGSGIFADCNDNSTVVLEVDNNLVIGGPNDFGMSFRSRSGAGRMDVTVTNNTITVPGSAFYDLELLTGDLNTLCGDIRNNMASGAGLFGVAYRVRESAGTMLLHNFMTDAVTTYNNGVNSPINSVSESPTGSASGGTCVTVTHPSP